MASSSAIGKFFARFKSKKTEENKKGNNQSNGASFDQLENNNQPPDHQDNPPVHNHSDHPLVHGDHPLVHHHHHDHPPVHHDQSPVHHDHPPPPSQVEHTQARQANERKPNTIAPIVRSDSEPLSARQRGESILQVIKLSSTQINEENTDFEKRNLNVNDDIRQRKLPIVPSFDSFDYLSAVSELSETSENQSPLILSAVSSPQGYVFGNSLSPTIETSASGTTPTPSRSGDEKFEILPIISPVGKGRVSPFSGKVVGNSLWTICDQATIMAMGPVLSTTNIQPFIGGEVITLDINDEESKSDISIASTGNTTDTTYTSDTSVGSSSGNETSSVSTKSMIGESDRVGEKAVDLLKPPRQRKGRIKNKTNATLDNDSNDNPDVHIKVFSPENNADETAEDNSSFRHISDNDNEAHAHEKSSKELLRVRSEVQYFDDIPTVLKLIGLKGAVQEDDALSDRSCLEVISPLDSSITSCTALHAFSDESKPDTDTTEKIVNPHFVNTLPPVIFKLHWLPVKFRILYKILLLTYKCIHYPRLGPIIPH